MAGDTANEAGRIFSFQCLHCGSPIEVNAPGLSLTFVCQSCGSIVQEDNRGLRVLIKAQQEMHVKPLLELGSKGLLGNVRWQVIGFMVRAAIGERYQWREYLLFNPYEGYRWLTEADGHWNFLTAVREKPEVKKTANGSIINWDKRGYKLFYRGNAEVRFVLGEFYWLVKIGDEAKLTDFVSPPRILSLEQTSDEMVWTSGIYIEPSAIEAAFKRDAPMPTRKRIAPNQPWPHQHKAAKLYKSWIFFAVLLLVFQWTLSSVNPTRKILSESLHVDPSAPAAVLKTQSFTVTEADKVLEIQISSSLSESWLGVAGTFVPETANGERTEFQRELAVYQSSGDDDDDGVYNGSSSLHFNRLAPGTYHLEFRATADNVRNTWTNGAGPDLFVSVRNGRGTSPFWMCFLLISIYPIGFYLMSYVFETSRWADSNVLEPK